MDKPKFNSSFLPCIVYFQGNIANLEISEQNLTVSPEFCIKSNSLSQLVVYLLRPPKLDVSMNSQTNHN